MTTRYLRVTVWVSSVFTAIAVILIGLSIGTPGSKRDDGRPSSTLVQGLDYIWDSIALCASEAYKSRGHEDGQGCSVRSVISKAMTEIHRADDIESVWINPEWIEVLMTRGRLNEPLVAYKVQDDPIEYGVILMRGDRQLDVVSSIPKEFFLIYGE